MILAAGTSNKPGYRQRQDGFSLLEILVVLCILGILTSFINIAGNSKARQVEEAAERLTALISLAQQEAMLNGMNFMVRIDEGGYTFLRQEEDKWRPLTDDEVFHPRKLPPGARAAASVEGSASDRGIFLSASGEITPFVIQITEKDTDIGFTITGSYPCRLTCVASDG